MSEGVSRADYLDNPDMWLAGSHPALARQKPEDLFEAEFAKRYRRLHNDIYERMVRADGTLHTLERLRAFPFDHICTPDQRVFWRLVIHNFIDVAVILLHGLVGDTGTDTHTLNSFKNQIDQAQWKSVGALLLDRGLLPLVDLAYMGLGSGLDEDAFGVRHLATVVPEMAVAVSCSKNFAVYRDRVGAAMILSAKPDQAQIVTGKLGAIARSLWSMPPDHAAAAVRIVLEDEGLRASWKSELDGMRQRIQTLRAELANALNRQSNSQAFDFIVKQAGMFSRLPLTEGQAQRLKDKHAVYIVPDGRINVAGLNAENTAVFAKAYAETK